MTDMWLAEYRDLVHQLSAEFNRKYPYIEPADIQQVLWLWFVSHPKKIKEWLQLEHKDRDKLIIKSLRNAAIKHCEREKAKKFGYELLDLYYYDTSVIEVFLPSIISNSYEMPASIKDLNFKVSKGEISDGNNWLVLRADIEKAFNHLAEAKQNILRLRFSQENCEWNELAKELNTSQDGARMKVQRAMNSLIRKLGGWRSFNDEDTNSVNEESTEEVDDE